MTQQEAERLVPILLSADGGCSVCVRGMICEAILAFPEHDWIALALKAENFKNLCETEQDFRESIAFEMEEREAEGRVVKAGI